MKTKFAYKMIMFEKALEIQKGCNICKDNNIFGDGTFNEESLHPHIEKLCLFKKLFIILATWVNPLTYRAQS
jgi:hypothetical protein